MTDQFRAIYKHLDKRFGKVYYVCMKPTYMTEAAKPRYKRVLAMHEAGVKIEEIARIEGVGRTMVYYLLARGKKMRDEMTRV